MELQERIDALPTSPGVYLMKGARDRVLYVGKAQSLRDRVRSYFRAGGDGRPRIERLAARVVDVEVVVTAHVKDALLLENELIKRHKPPFNVRLRDDKQYLALRLDPRDTWPRLTMVRRFKQDGALYFGPYTSSVSMKDAISNLRRIFPLRSCTDGTFRDYQRRGRPCIEYEMNRCAAPCVGHVGEAEYGELVDGTALFLRGRSADLVRDLGARMQAAAEGERFEEAARLRDRIQAVERTVERQQIVAERPIDRDVFGLARRGGEVEMQVLHVRDGRVTGTASYGFSDVSLDDGEVVTSFLGQFYGAVDARPIPREVVTPAPVEDEGALEAVLRERKGGAVSLRAPRRGNLRELLTMAEANAELALAQRVDARASLDAALAEVREKIGLRGTPRRIECYDVSTLQGSLTVASRVLFVDGRPETQGYRRYRIKTAPGGDDLACLREVLTRRLDRIESDPLPDLLMVDGGKGQLGVLTALLRDRGLECDALGLAKERDAESPSPRVRRSGGLKAERIFLPQRKDALLLPPSSRALLLLQRVRDESHRFAIDFQRSLRRKVGLTSILEELPGIGPGKRRALLRQLGSLRAVRQASHAALLAVPGISSGDADTLRAFFDATPVADPAPVDPVPAEPAPTDPGPASPDAESAAPDGPQAPGEPPREP